MNYKTNLFGESSIRDLSTRNTKVHYQTKSKQLIFSHFNMYSLISLSLAKRNLDQTVVH